MPKCLSDNYGIDELVRIFTNSKLNKRKYPNLQFQDITGKKKYLNQARLK